MADESERWNRVQHRSGSKERFHAKASQVALHTDPQRRRNLDKEEAARDRLIFRWVMLILGVALMVAMVFFFLPRLTSE